MTLDLNDYRGRVLVTDGAWGTQLQQRGLPAGSCPELWNVEHPQAVKDVARAYIVAGSDIILTNTFGANGPVLARHGAADRLAELAEAGVALSRRAAGSDVLVFASMGPTGRMLMIEEHAADELYSSFATAARAFADGGADAVVIETMTEPAEAALAARAVRDTTDLPIVASLTYGSGPDGMATMMGAHPADVLSALDGLDVGAFGANCGVGPEAYIKVIRRYRELTDAPLWVKANAGLPVMRNGTSVFPLGPDAYAAFVPALIAAGATFIGGCCGTGPDHIAAIRKAVDDAG
ncbi:MAG: homocysteine S-methyltransferase family protein [Planctomycetota bacterium]